MMKMISAEPVHSSPYLHDASQSPLASWVCQAYFPFCSLIYVSVSPVCGISTVLFSINVICPVLYILQGHAQDSWRLSSLTYRLLIITHSDSKFPPNARMASRFLGAYTSSCLVVTVGNTVLSISLRSGLNWKTANKLAISPLDLRRLRVLGMLYTCSSSSHVLISEWITMFQNQLSRRKTQVIYSWNEIKLCHKTNWPDTAHLFLKVIR